MPLPISQTITYRLMLKNLRLKSFAKFFFYFAVVLIPFYLVRFDISGIPTTLPEVVLYLSFVLAVIAGWKKAKFPKTAVFAGLIFVFFALASAAYPNGSLGSLGIWRAYFFDAILIFVNYLLLQDENKREGTTEILILAAAVVSLVCLIEFTTGIKTADGRLLDLAQLSPNYLSLYLAPVLVMAAVYLVRLRRRNWILLISAIIITGALLLTGSRGGIVAVVVALAFYLAEKFLPSRRLINCARLVLVIIFLLGGYLVFKPDFGAYGRVGNSSNIRFYIWQTTLEIVGKNPLTGVGLNNYQSYFTQLTKDRINFPEFIAPQALTAHNLYLHLLSVGGPLLLVSFLGFIWSSRFYRSKDYLKFALVALFVYGLIDTPIFRNDLALFFALVMAMSLPERDEK